MHSYIGTKRVNAKPMNRGEYHALRGWESAYDEDPADEGFLVEYQDGGKANHPDFAGYISWSPKDIFERAYKLLPGAGLPEYQQRVLLEKAELDERLTKLSAFINSGAFVNIVPDNDERARLTRQETAMHAYAEILAERIAAFPNVSAAA